MKLAFFGNSRASLESVYSRAQRERLCNSFEVAPCFIDTQNFDSMLPELERVTAIFSTWGMPRLDAEQVSRMPDLRVLFYGAGSVKRFAVPFLEKGIGISSGWRVNGEIVAKFTMAQIILACKGYFGNTLNYSAGRPVALGPGVHAKTTVALLGCGAVARHLIGLFKDNFGLNILAYDPHLDEKEASGLGVTKAGLSRCFEEALVVSNHMPDIPETRGILDGALFGAMRENATFINTGRGASVENEGFLKVFSERADLTALLDVTSPEPLPSDSPLLKMPNVRISTHIAGAINFEKQLIGDRMIANFFHWLQYGIIRDEIVMGMLNQMA